MSQTIPGISMGWYGKYNIPDLHCGQHSPSGTYETQPGLQVTDAHLTVEQSENEDIF